ncbi:hypothetical protein ACJX0J_001730 [Zea mays]
MEGFQPSEQRNREFLLLSFFLSIEEYRLLEFGLSKKPWYRILIVNFYTELENYIFVINPCLKRIIEVTLNPLLLGFKKRIKINKKKFHNKSLDSELGTHNLSFGFLVF